MTSLLYIGLRNTGSSVYLIFIQVLYLGYEADIETENNISLLDTTTGLYTDTGGYRQDTGGI